MNNDLNNLAAANLSIMNGCCGCAMMIVWLIIIVFALQFCAAFFAPTT